MIKQKPLSPEDHQKAQDVKAIAATPSGRRFFWRYLGITKVYETSFTGNSETFFNEGKRVVGLNMIGELMQHAPEEYFKMIKENSKGQE